MTTIELATAWCSTSRATTIDFLHYVMEERGLSRKDMEQYIGPRGRVSDILNRVRPLSLEMIRRLCSGLGLPATVLIQDYLLRQEVA